MSVPTPIPIPTPAPRPDDLIPHLPAMARRARRLTRSRDQADDLLQEAALRIWTRLARGARVEDLRAYSMITLRNLARTHARRAQDEVSIEDDMATVDGDALRHLACRETRAAIARLPRAQAELLALVLAGQASPAALARATGCPVGTVMSRLARARASLRRDMGLGADRSVTDLF